MLFAAKYAWILIAIAGWNTVTWTMFIKNLSKSYRAGEQRPKGYWIAHSVLIVVNLIIAVVLAWIGVKALTALD